MAILISAIRHLLLKPVLAVALVMGASSGCASEDVGTLQVGLTLRDRAGQPQSCAALGATGVQVSLYARADDSLAYDRVERDCEITADGSGFVAFDVAAGTYHHAEVRFLSVNGNTVRLCTDEGSADAVVTQNEVRVDPKRQTQIRVALEGDPGSCAN